MSTPNRKSIAENQDLNWEQIKKTVLLLHAATAQIKSSMTDGDESVMALTESFTTLVGKVSIIGNVAESLGESTEKETILSNYNDVLEQVQSAIVAFQFYDRMTQRLEHVSKSLGSLAELIGETDRAFSPHEWKGLQKTILSRYTNESDRSLFEEILNGTSVEEALKTAKEKAGNEPDEVIELF